ncbi:hypothetical protein HAP94_02095 [Acidithiobacillus ferrivorans]|nr:hypothetical protein [Acidithiobacillus ferrivorans]
MYPNPPIALQITIPADWPLSPIDRDILTMRLRYALNDPEFWSASDEGDFTTHLERLRGGLLPLFRGMSPVPTVPEDIKEDVSWQALRVASMHHLTTAVLNKGLSTVSRVMGVEITSVDIPDSSLPAVDPHAPWWSRRRPDRLCPIAPNGTLHDLTAHWTLASRDALRRTITIHTLTAFAIGFFLGVLLIA